MNKIIPYIIILFAGMLIGWMVRKPRTEVRELTQRDTLVLIDTIRECRPIEISKEVRDSFFVEVRDTVWINDTLYLNLPMETKVYSSDDYYAEVCGYKPSLYYLEVYPKTKVITESISYKKSKNSIGLGIEANYLNAASIPIYLEYTRMLHKNFEIYGQVFYDMQIRDIGVGIGIKAQIEW